MIPARIAVVLLAVTIISTAAQATTFIGSTAGCFGDPCSPSLSKTDHNLTFTGYSSFIEMTQGPTNSVGFNLGTFTLKDTSLFGLHIFNNEAFDLEVTLSSPSSLTHNFTADVTGIVTVLGGAVSIDFNPATISFGPSDSYSLKINNLSLGTSIFTGGKVTEDLTGTFATKSAVGSVPEPSTWAMLIIGFAALGFWRLRRQSIASAKA